jgi:sugar phosphate isomerase/epimerase
MAKDKQMTDRIISVSAAPYDGYSVEVMLESLAQLGVTHVEPAFIVGYTEPFDETAFIPARVREWRRALSDAGLSCHTLSSHIDLGLEDAVEVFTGRMAFAAAIGARIVCTNASAREREGAFYRNMEKLVRRAEAFDIVIALENPGDGSDNLINTATDGVRLCTRFNNEHVGLNYDAGNTASHRPDLVDLAADAVLALPMSVHAHIKDVRRTEDGWTFTSIGDGEVGCAAIVSAIRNYEMLPISIEIPLRLSRGPDAKPIRLAHPIALDVIEAKLRVSLAKVTSLLDQHET